MNKVTSKWKVMFIHFSKTCSHRYQSYRNCLQSSVKEVIPTSGVNKTVTTPCTSNVNSVCSALKSCCFWCKNHTSLPASVCQYWHGLCEHLDAAVRSADHKGIIIQLQVFSSHFYRLYICGLYNNIFVN